MFGFVTSLIFCLVYCILGSCWLGSLPAENC